MKHAINELQALLDTWGGQKEQSWNDSINDAINVLEAEQHRADMAETSREENANGGPDDAEPTQEQIAQAYAEAAGVPVGCSVDAIKKASQDIEYDIGELDASKACKLDNPDCESCS